MKEFKLVSKDLQDYKQGLVEDLMYDVIGNIDLIKSIIKNKINHFYDPLDLNPNLIKQVKFYVAKSNDYNKTDIFLDIDEYNDLYSIASLFNLKIDDVDTIKNIVVDWLLG